MTLPGHSRRAPGPRRRRGRRARLQTDLCNSQEANHCGASCGARSPPCQPNPAIHLARPWDGW
eukprot:1834837-Lingulodinium_polyedra.AAC.1